MGDLASYVVRGLILPPSSPFVAIAVGWLLRRRSLILGRCIMAAGALALYALCTPLVAAALLRCLEPDPVVNLVPPVDAGAIVVLGGDADSDGREYGGNSAGPLTLVRIRYAATLQRKTGLPILVTGGRLSTSGPPVSFLMRDALTGEFDVPVRWVESASKDTWQNAAFTAELLRREKIGKVILVTHAWHMLRAKVAFAAAGVAVLPAPTGFTAWPGDTVLAVLPDAKALLNSAYAIHEMVGLLWYRLASL